MGKPKTSPFYESLAAIGDFCQEICLQSARHISEGAVCPPQEPAALSGAQQRLFALEAALLTAFVTPLDRRDLCRLGQKAYGFAQAAGRLSAALPPAHYRQQTANWVLEAGKATKNLLADFANYKKYAILLKKIRLLRQSGLLGLRLWRQSIPFSAEPFLGNLRQVAEAACALADCAAEALIVNL